MHQHYWYASFCGLGFLGSTCKCGARTFLGGFRGYVANPERYERIVERLNRSWRVR